MSSQTPSASRPQSHRARNIAIAVVIGVIILVAGFLVVLSLRGGGILPSTHTENIVNGLVTVNAGTYEYYQFDVPSGASNIQVSGSFTASGGSGNDIKVYVMDSTNFINWKNGHSAGTYYNSGQLTTDTISATLSSSGTYFIVYDNTFSIISQKNVNTQVNLSYTL